MRIEIKNFGPIRQLEFDLDKGLHLIYGANAIGKSYATHCVYGLLKCLNVIGAVRISFGGQLNDIYGHLENSLALADRVDLTNEFHEDLEQELKSSIVEDFENFLRNTFSSLPNLKNRYSGEDFEIVIKPNPHTKLVLHPGDAGNLALRYIAAKQKVEMLKKVGDTTTFSLLLERELVFTDLEEAKFVDAFFGFRHTKIHEIETMLRTGIRDLRYLPASRSGLYQALSAFAPIIAELTQSRYMVQQRSITLPALSEPLSDYFIDLSTVNKKNINTDFDHLIAALQRDILKGEVDYDDQAKRIVYKPAQLDLELNMSEASSMVAEISPLVIYLRHILGQKHPKIRTPGQSRGKGEGEFDILFIEEPEAHLHPDVQVALMEVFAKLPGLGVKIFITSHSNYMFNKLNNLLLSEALTPSEVVVYHLVKEEGGTVQNDEMQVTQEGIMDDNFQNVSEKLYNERMQIYAHKHAG